MPWVWTDEMAAALREHDGIEPKQVAGWIERPVALAATDDSTVLELARRLLSSKDPAA